MKTADKIHLPDFVIEPELKTFDLAYRKDYKIPTNYSHGIRWVADNGHRFRSVVSEQDFRFGKRIAWLQQSNLLFSLGASHYYADVIFHGPKVHDLNENKMFSMAGYGKEYNKIRQYLGRVTIKAERRLTKVEKDMNGDPIGKVGSWTYRFNSEEDAKAAAIKTFLERFQKGWVLLDEEDDNLTLGET